MIIQHVKLECFSLANVFLTCGKVFELIKLECLSVAIILILLLNPGRLNTALHSNIKLR
jgi:hypothetical protein